FGNSGIAIRNGAANNRIGTDTENDPNDANVIGGNLGNGIVLQSTGTVQNVVAGNFIGTNASGANLGNALRGVVIYLGSRNNFSGTDQNGLVGPATGNTIAFNGGPGVWVFSWASWIFYNTTGNRIEGNSMFANAGLGIDLSGSWPTPDFNGDGV